MTHKKEYNFNFAKCMHFFLKNIDACIDRHNIDISPELTVTFTVSAYSYPFNLDVISLVQKTFKRRRVNVVISSYKCEVTEKGVDKYTYVFKLSRINSTTTTK